MAENRIAALMLPILGAVVLAACAVRPDDAVTVHVFSNQPGAGALRSLAGRLDAAGYDHRIAYAETPGGLSVDESVVVHADDAGGYNRAREVAAMVAEVLGSEPRIKAGRHGNHAFTGGNLGVYIHRPAAADSAGRERVAARYAGSCGEYSAELELLAAGGFRLELLRWDDEAMAHEKLATARGRWSEHDAELALESGEGRTWTAERRPGYGGGTDLVMSGPEQVAGCRLQQPL